MCRSGNNFKPCRVDRCILQIALETLFFFQDTVVCKKRETSLISDRRIFQEGKTPLHVAAEAGNADGVLFLQIQGASNDPTDWVSGVA